VVVGGSVVVVVVFLAVDVVPLAAVPLGLPPHAAKERAASTKAKAGPTVRVRERWGAVTGSEQAEVFRARICQSGAFAFGCIGPS
jgi:hypothetical protein